LTGSAAGMTDEQYEADKKVCGLRGGRELMTRQVAKLPSSAWSRVGELTKEVLVNLGCYRAREPAEIAAPRQVGARNDKRAWCWMNQATTKAWRRDLQEQVSSLFLAPLAQTSSDFSYLSVCATDQGRGRTRLMSKTTISARGAFSTGRVPVGRGR
jgi:hypothetical protein